jgi:hypothetical protein
MVHQDAWIVGQVVSPCRPTTLSRALRLCHRTMWARTESEGKFPHFFGLLSWVLMGLFPYTVLYICRTRLTDHRCHSASDVSISDAPCRTSASGSVSPLPFAPFSHPLGLSAVPLVWFVFD